MSKQHEELPLEEASSPGGLLRLVIDRPHGNVDVILSTTGDTVELEIAEDSGKNDADDPTVVLKGAEVRMLKDILCSPIVDAWLKRFEKGSTHE